MSTFLLIVFAIAVLWIWKNVAKVQAGQKATAEVNETGRTFYSKVVGVSYNNPDGTSRQRIIKTHCKAGQSLQLKPEPDNPHDPNALGVWVSAGQIGYIEGGRLAEDLSRYLNSGITVRVLVKGVTGGASDQPMCGVNISIHIEK